MSVRGEVRILCRRGDGWTHEHFQDVQAGAQEFADWWQGVAARNVHAPNSFLWLQDQIGAHHPLDIVDTVTVTTRHGKAVRLHDCLFRGYAEEKRVAFFEFSVIQAQRESILPWLIDVPPNELRAFTLKLRTHPYLILAVPITETLEAVAACVMPLGQLVDPRLELWPADTQAAVLEAARL